MKMKILFFVPHLSTGGMPQYVVWLVSELLKTNNKENVFVVEYSDIAPIYVVQKDRLRNFLGSNLITLYGTDQEKHQQLLKLLNQINPSIIHFQEFPEMWLPDFISKDLYSNRKMNFKIIETSHDSSFDPKNKKYFPDGFSFISNFHVPLYKNLNIPYSIIEYPIVKKERPDRSSSLIKLGLDPEYVHILNVGLFTPRKNQSEIFDMAKKLSEYKIQFHFVGNQADNFRGYWEPLMRHKPDNCVIWGERNDVDNFYSCMDAFLFVSKGTISDRETNPLVIKEAFGWSLPVFMYNLPVYCGMYDFNKKYFLEDDIDKNCEKILDYFNLRSNVISTEKLLFDYKFSVENNHPRIEFECKKDVLPDRDSFAVMRDLQTNLGMHSFSFRCVCGYGYFFAPAMTMDDITGVSFEIYDPDLNLIFRDEIKTDCNKHINVGVEGKLFCGKIDMSFFAYCEIFERQLYNEKKRIKKGDVVVDLGSNIGLFSLYAFTNGASKVYSVEPCHDTFLNLDSNLSHFGDKSVRINAAILRNNGDTDLIINRDRSTVNSIYLNDYFSSDRERVISLNINNFFREHVKDKVVNFLKIDIEGAEYDLFESMDEEILKNRIEYISLEHHSLSKNGVRFNNIIKKLEKCGFDHDLDGNPDTGLCFFSKRSGIVVEDIEHIPIIMKSENEYKLEEKLKIAQVAVGPDIKIPPTGWGAIEEVIWNYKIELEKIGCICDIKFQEEDFRGYDIVHVHTHNQTKIFYEQNIPYIFTMHDIHPYLYGKESPLFKSHHEAIENSFLSLSPNKFFKKYFGSDKIVYLSHGSNIDFYTPRDYINRTENVLCVAANGKWDEEHDCKGFALACEAAKKMNLSITLAGPNEEWFKKSNYDFNYDKLNIINKNLNKQEMLDLYKRHDILLNLSTNESGQPNLVILEALSCGLPVVCTSIDDIQIAGIKVVKRDIKSAIEGIVDVMQHKKEYYYGALLSSQKYSWKNICDQLIKHYLNCYSSMNIVKYKMTKI